MPAGVAPLVRFSEQEQYDMEQALLMRLGFRVDDILEMDEYTRSLILAFETKANYLRDKNLARMLAGEIAQLFKT